MSTPPYNLKIERNQQPFFHLPLIEVTDAQLPSRYFSTAVGSATFYEFFRVESFVSFFI